MLIKKAKEELIAQARECEKIEFLLAMALTSANMTTLFIEDFERRVRGIYRREKSKSDTRHEARMLRKDLDLAESMDAALNKITDFIENIRNDYYKSISEYISDIECNLESIDAQYRHYIQSHVDKIFSKGGKYNVNASDQFHSDAGEFATFLLEMARVAHHNKSNADEVYAFMKSMHNTNALDKENTFCLDDRDLAHYRLKE